MKKSKSTATTLKAAAAKAVTKANQIHAWENDPFAQAVPTPTPALATPIVRPVPHLSTSPLPVAINGAQPVPRLYNTGTPEFRYWTAAEALRRGADFWGSKLPGVKWHSTVGSRLAVNLDAGQDFNAFYNRKNLDFFHGSVAGLTVFSGESPDVVCHELGHAVLDAFRPQLWNAGFIEAAAFHESFGDMSAMLSALQLPTMRQDVLAETHGRLSQSSSLSRLAEQLGYAIRKLQPSAVDPDCLRNAANSFFYRDPSTLPPSAPANALSSEAHSFSRVFTGAFLEVLANLLHVAVGSGLPTDAQLQVASSKAADYLIDGIRSAAVVPTYYSQVASAVVQASSAADRNAVASAFVHHGILSLAAAATASDERSAVAGVPMVDSTQTVELEEISINFAEYGLGAEPVLVHAAAEANRFLAVGAVLGVAAVAAVAPEQAAKDFVEDLLQLGRIELTQAGVGGVAAFAAPFAQPRKLKTHEITRNGKALRLRRVRFDCGFDCVCCSA